jgi:hypothetical protein
MSCRATPTVHHPKLLLLFFLAQNRKNLLQQFPIIGCHLSQVGKNDSGCAHVCAQRSVAHPFRLEEVEEYKNIFVFSQDS